jgi:hypothetical protein
MGKKPEELEAEASVVQGAAPASALPESEGDMYDELLARFDTLAAEVKSLREGSAGMPEILAFTKRVGPLADRLEKHAPLLDRLAAMLGVGADGAKPRSLFDLLKWNATPKGVGK